MLPAVNTLEDRLGIPMPFPEKPGGIARIFRQVRCADAVLVHDALYPTSVLSFFAARLWHKPIIVAMHIGQVPYRNRLLRGMMKLANRLVARPLLAGAYRVAFVSKTTASHFSTVRFRSPPALIFNGTDTETFRPAGRESKMRARDLLGLPRDRAVALFVGRFVEKKGLHLLARMARLRPDLIWALAGWGPIDPESWGLPNVKVFRNLSGSSLAPLYQASDALVLPSVGEGFPLVIQEALACGLPVVCSNETAGADPAAQPLLTPVAMDRNDAGMLAGAYCAAVDRVLANEQADPEAADQRAQFAAERYSWIGCASRYLDLMEPAAWTQRLDPLEPVSNVQSRASSQSRTSDGGDAASLFANDSGHSFDGR